LQQQLEDEIQKLLPLVKDHVIATSQDKIEKILADILTDRKLTFLPQKAVQAENSQK
jgi:nicotinamide-nucleotide amidase